MLCRFRGIWLAGEILLAFERLVVFGIASLEVVLLLVESFAVADYPLHFIYKIINIAVIIQPIMDVLS